MIGLLGKDAHWRSLLGQEGVAFVCDALDQLDRATGPNPPIRALILDRTVERAEASAVKRYLGQGGALLSFAGNVRTVWSELKTKRTRLDFVLPDDSPLFRNVGIVDLCADGTVVSGANYGRTPSGRPALFCDRIVGAPVILLPFDPAHILKPTGSVPRVFPAGAPRPVFETVTKVNRGEVRRLIANCLKYLLCEQDIAYVRLAYSPDATALFGVRIDTDSGSDSAARAVAAVAHENRMRFSWYVHTGTAENSLRTLVRDVLAGQDIQLHCFRHRVYPDFARSHEDIEKGINLLRRHGIAPVGVAAPYGQWNPNWSRAAAEAGMVYSSEFAVGHDDLPFRPMLGAGPSAVLQVPVHPICVGRLSAARMQPDRMAAYFHDVIARQAARLEPCFIYDHPETVARFPEVFGQTVAYGIRRCGQTTTMTEYAQWWLGRERIRYTVSADGNRLSPAVETGAADARLIVEREGSWAETFLKDGAVELDRLDWRPVHIIQTDVGRWREARLPCLRVKYQELLRAGKRWLESRSTI